MDKIKLLKRLSVVTMSMLAITLTACISQSVQPIKQNNAQQIIKKTSETNHTKISNRKTISRRYGTY